MKVFPLESLAVYGITRIILKIMNIKKGVGIDRYNNYIKREQDKNHALATRLATNSGQSI